jgi:hypothetical protein
MCSTPSTWQTLRTVCSICSLTRCGGHRCEMRLRSGQEPDQLAP